MDSFYVNSRYADCRQIKRKLLNVKKVDNKGNS